MSSACVKIEIPTSPSKMPLFSRSKSLRRSKRKNKIKKTDISDPRDFQHFYHAEYDVKKEGIKGLPTQWKSLLDTDSGRVSKSVGNTPEPVKRPSPIVKGTKDGLQEAIDYVKNHYQSFAAEDEDEEQREKNLEEFIDITLVSQRSSQCSSRNSSHHQLPSPHPNNSTLPPHHPPVSQHLNQTHSQIMSQQCPVTSRLPHCANTSFYFNAPLDVIRSDLGLYDGENMSLYTNSSSAIYSPSDSSGYFGSTMSSLYSSRISSSQHIAATPSLTTYQNPSHHPPLTPVHSYHYDTTIEPTPTQRFASLQRPSKQKEQQLLNNTYSLYKQQQLRRMRQAQTNSTQIPTVCSQETGMSRANNTMASTSGIYSRQTQQQHQQHRKPHAKDQYRMSDEQFKATLKVLVNPKDPRDDLDGFVKIGVGSTGSVYTAYRISTNEIVAVKKMSLFNQQRKELLFNEVSIIILHI